MNKAYAILKLMVSLELLFCIVPKIAFASSANVQMSFDNSSVNYKLHLKHGYYFSENGINKIILVFGKNSTPHLTDSEETIRVYLDTNDLSITDGIELSKTTAQVIRCCLPSLYGSAKINNISIYTKSNDKLYISSNLIMSKFKISRPAYPKNLAITFKKIPITKLSALEFTKNKEILQDRELFIKIFNE